MMMTVTFMLEKKIARKFKKTRHLALRQKHCASRGYRKSGYRRAWRLHCQAHGRRFHSRLVGRSYPPAFQSAAAALSRLRSHTRSWIGLIASMPGSRKREPASLKRELECGEFV
jgi:hypothetical protein